MTHALTEVVEDLATLVGSIPPDRGALPTPCPGLDVAALRHHVLGWVPVFATALSDPNGAERPDPAEYRAPDDAAAASAQVREAGNVIERALAAGVEERPVRLLGGEQPGSTVVAMLAAEVITHGWDLARATGLPWSPSPQLCDRARDNLATTLQPQFRGPGRPFGHEVPVPDDAGSLDRLLAFSGRDPSWTAPSV
jgi:uncharacterized protein (TIGR03086 family)